MDCPGCRREVEESQKFCRHCGRELAGVTMPTEALPVTAPPDLPVQDDDELEPTLEIGVIAGDSAVDEPTVRLEKLPDVADLPTREIQTRDPIPEPHWANDPDDTDDTDDTADAVDTATNDAVPTASAVRAEVPLPVVDSDSTTQMSVQDSAVSVVPDSAAFVPRDIVTSVHPVQSAAVFDGSADVAEYPPTREAFKLKLVFVFAFFGALAVLMSAIADIIDIRTSEPVSGIATGVRTLDTLGTNLALAGFVGALVMVIGGLLACFGYRWGAGLAGGAGLALTGWAGLTAGLAELRVADAESKTRQTVDLAFTLLIKRDIGFWLIVAVAVIGIVVFITSLRSFGTGGQPALNPWIAAVGAVAGVVLAGGPLLPEGNATFVNNVRSPTTRLDIPSLYFAGRIGQVALIAFAVVFGLLIVRSYGLGLAAGGVSVGAWMWLTSLLGLGSFPLGIAAGNFGADSSTPHAVTTVGVVLTLFMLAVAAILAVIGTQRQRRFTR